MKMHLVEWRFNAWKVKTTGEMDLYEFDGISRKIEHLPLLLLSNCQILSLGL